MVVILFGIIFENRIERASHVCPVKINGIKIINKIIHMDMFAVAAAGGGGLGGRKLIS